MKSCIYTHSIFLDFPFSFTIITILIFAVVISPK